MTFLYPNALIRAGTTSFWYRSCILFIIYCSCQRLINLRLAFLADAMGTFFIPRDAHPGRFVALRADQHDIRNRDGSLELDPARVDIASCLGLDLALVLGADVDTLDHDPAFIRIEP